MFDVGFWELLVIAVIALLVLGPERLPEVAKQAAFFVRKARHSMYRLRSEMQSELTDTPFADLQKARQEVSDFKNDIKQLGSELADAAERKQNDSSEGARHDADAQPAPEMVALDAESPTTQTDAANVSTSRTGSSKQSD